MKRVIAGLMTMLLVLVAVGCSAPKPEEAVKVFMDAMIRGDYQQAGELVVGGSYNPASGTPSDTELEGERLVNALLSRVTYQIGESNITGNSATVKTTITAPDMVTITGLVFLEALQAAFELAFSGQGSEEEINELFMSNYETAIRAQDAPMVTSTATIKLTKEDGKWLIVTDDELSNALTGNLISALAELDWD